jgi:hypothetical protein
LARKENIMHRIYPFQGNSSSVEFDKRYKPDPDKATQWLKLILKKGEDDVDKNKSDSNDK